MLPNAGSAHFSLGSIDSFALFTANKDIAASSMGYEGMAASDKRISSGDRRNAESARFSLRSFDSFALLTYSKQGPCG